MSALGRGNGQVFFIGVARYSDKVIVAGKDFQEDIRTSSSCASCVSKRLTSSLPLILPPATSTVQGLFNNIQGEVRQDPVIRLLSYI